MFSKNGTAVYTTKIYLRAISGMRSEDKKQKRKTGTGKYPRVRSDSCIKKVCIYIAGFEGKT